VSVNVQVGQDSRADVGLGTAAATTTVTPFAGQNGCFPLPWFVNGFYKATIQRSGASTSAGFCVPVASLGANEPNLSFLAGAAKCAQVALSTNLATVPRGTTVTGAVVTGADNHAVEVCVAAFTPNPGGGTTPTTALASTVNAYNQSGAVDLTPLTLNFPAGTEVLVDTLDLTGPGPGGTGGAQVPCPAVTATQNAQRTQIQETSVTAPPGATFIDGRVFTIQ
jgi:hypothetical protein